MALEVMLLGVRQAAKYYLWCHEIECHFHLGAIYIHVFWVGIFSLALYLH